MILDAARLKVRRQRFVLCLVVLCIGLASSVTSHATLLQILHTNDLHSYLDHAEDQNSGSYAAVKALIDHLKSQAASQGIETINLNAGDFLEGGIFYLSNQAQETYQAMEAMEYDAITLGNHDWLMGVESLDNLFNRINPQTPLLAANFFSPDNTPKAQEVIRPYRILTRGGYKIGILGLTTNELFYEWATFGASIDNPTQVAKAWLPTLRAESDLVIGLTHLGFKGDKKLVDSTQGWDLIVGGHSHTELHEPYWQLDSRGKPIPIVQAGRHGEKVGRLMIDILGPHDYRIVSYELIPVRRSMAEEFPQTPGVLKIKSLIQTAEAFLNQNYGETWLNTPIAQSEVELKVPDEGPSEFGNLVAEAMRQAAGAEVGIDFHVFNGVDQPAGPITRKDIMRFYPHQFEQNRPLGVNVWKARVAGHVIKRIFEISLGKGYMPSLAGIKLEIYRDFSGSPKIWSLKINGREIKDARRYSVATTEGIIRGAVTVSDLTRVIIRGAQDTGVPIWSAIENRLTQVQLLQSDPSQAMTFIQHPEHDPALLLERTTRELEEKLKQEQDQNQSRRRH